MEKDKTLPQGRRVNRKRQDIEKGRFSHHERHKMIEESAYYKYKAREHGNGGDHLDDWLRAEAEIDAMLNAS